MLALTRNEGQAITVTGPCRVTLIDIRSTRARLGFDAEPSTTIQRDEGETANPKLYEEANAQREAEHRAFKLLERIASVIVGRPSQAVDTLDWCIERAKEIVAEAPAGRGGRRDPA